MQVEQTGIVKGPVPEAQPVKKVPRKRKAPAKTVTTTTTDEEAGTKKFRKWEEPPNMTKCRVTRFQEWYAANKKVNLSKEVNEFLQLDKQKIDDFLKDKALSFGKFKGIPLQDLKNNVPSGSSYLDFLIQQEWLFPDVRAVLEFVRDYA